jgi:general secretion pathway protein B
MSFILDALKKAESERSRASGPVLVDVRIAPARRNLPAWAWALGLVLLANLAILGWLLLRGPATPEVAATPPELAVVSPQPVPATSVTATTPVQAPLTPAASPATVPALVYEPPPAAAQTQAAPAAAIPPADAGTLPTVQQLQAAGVALPPLLLNLHVYDPTPSLRYVLLNGLRLAEGEFTPDGIKVELITERGVVLEARGRRFMLPAGG